MMENRAIIEALSWRLATETVRRAPDRLRIHEMHPGGGQHDSLTLYTPEGESIAYLNRSGSFTPWGTLGDTRNAPLKEKEPWNIWQDAVREQDPVRIVDRICQQIGLSVPKKLPPSTPAVLAYRFITEFLSCTVFRRSKWECRSGVLDSSGYGGGAGREEWFVPFPEAQERLRVREDRDLFTKPAYRFWFILRDSEPLLCLETTGTAWNLRGNAINLPNAYQGPRRIWPLIVDIAGNLLP